MGKGPQDGQQTALSERQRVPRTREREGGGRGKRDLQVAANTIEYVPKIQASSANPICRSSAMGAVIRNVADTPAASMNMLASQREIHGVDLEERDGLTQDRNKRVKHFFVPPVSSKEPWRYLSHVRRLRPYLSDPALLFRVYFRQVR